MCGKRPRQVSFLSVCSAPLFFSFFASSLFFTYVFPSRDIYFRRTFRNESDRGEFVNMFGAKKLAARSLFD